MQRAEGLRPKVCQGGCRGKSEYDVISMSSITICGTRAGAGTPPTSVAQVVSAATSIAGRALRAGRAVLVGGLANPVSPRDRAETP